MPTYDYRCPDGHVFERRAKMCEAASELECPVCGKIATRQLSGGAGLAFKGSGFYLTDYGKNAHRGTAPPGSKADSQSDSKSDSKAESKPDSKPGSKSESKSDSKSSSTSDTSGAKSSDAKSKSSKPKAE